MFRFPVSHRIFRQQPGPKRLFKPTEARAVETVQSWAAKYLTNAWLPPRWPVQLHEMPRDGVIRAVAYEAVRRYRKTTPQIPLLDRVLRAYCGLHMGHADRYVVGEYVYRQLRDRVAAEFRRRRSGLKRPLTRQDLEKVATLVLSDVEREITEMAADGRALKREHPRGYMYVRAQTKDGGRPCFLTLGKLDRTKVRPILCLQAPNRFDRGVNRNFGHRAYRNIPPQLYR
ncbi:MAG: hypothetical protein V1745_03520 [Patescibacteria group bacterium]